MTRLLTSLFTSLFCVCANADCTVEKFHSTNLVKFSNCDEYVHADTDLNNAYARLIKKIKPQQATHLRNIQRQWIVWRDETCLEAQKKVYCPSPICEGEEHDSCIIELTQTRTKELKKLLGSKSIIDNSAFEFAKEYKQE